MCVVMVICVIVQVSVRGSTLLMGLGVGVR